MIEELEPPIPSAEQLEADAKLRRDLIPYYEIIYLLNEQMWRDAFAWAKVEMARTHPDWARQFPELFR
jgi:hypothetical protein